MRVNTVLALIVLTLPFCCNSVAFNPINDLRIGHNTYVVGGRFISQKQVERINYSQYDFMYLMTGPKWLEENFDLADNQIKKSLIKPHRYPEGTKGESLVPAFLKHAKRAGVNVIYSVKVGRHGTYYLIAKDTLKRAKFAKAIVAYMKKYEMNGIDIDWEKQLDLNLHAALMGDIRNELDKLERKTSTKYYLTTALSTFKFKQYKQETVKKLVSYIDWVNFMTYDMGGGRWGNKASHNTPLDVMNSNLGKLKQLGFTEKKISIGLANYGFIYEGIAPDVDVPNGFKKISNFIAWNRFKPLLKEGWKKGTFDGKAKMSFYYNTDGKDFVTIDNPKSLEFKLDWVRDQKYSSIFWWELHLDYSETPQDSKYDSYELQDFVYKELNTKR